MVLGVGVDVVEVARIRRAVDRWGEAFLRRVYTPTELRQAAGRAGLERLAARFAAKEAVMKALGAGWGGMRFQDVEIVRGASGSPRAQLYGAAARRAEQAGVVAVHVSVTHARTYAAAVAVAEGRGEAGHR